MFSARPGKWHVQLIGSSGDLELRVSGPGVEASELLTPTSSPDDIAMVVVAILGS